MKVSRNWLQTYFDKPIPKADKLAEIFNFHAFEVEDIEMVEDNAVLDVKVLPDRAHYALSHRGIAREISAITGQLLKSNRIPHGPEATLTKAPEVRIEDKKFCRRYMARYAEIPSVKESNPHAVSMLASIGQRAINVIVDATNIVMFDSGQPLHIFDADKVVGTIVVRSAKAGEKILLLDSVAGADREVALLATDHVIADDDGPIAIAGVKGGKRTGVTVDTKHLIIESANFDPTSVRITSTRLNLRSESSKRYENEITPELTATGMNDVCALLIHNIPEAKFGPIVDIYPTKAKQAVIDFNPAYMEERLGVSVPLADIRDILMRLGIGVAEGKSWRLAIPHERLDIENPVDIVEEVGRIYGYDKIVSSLPPKLKDVVPMDKTFYWTEKVKSILFEQGFSELQTYTLVPKGDFEVAYPLASDKRALRKNLQDQMLTAFTSNAVNTTLLGLDEVKIFEIGKTFTKEGEKTSLCIGVSKKSDKKQPDAHATLLKDYLGLFKRMPGIVDVADSSDIKEGVSFDLKIKGTKSFVNSTSNIALREIDFDALVSKLPEPTSIADLDFKPLAGKRYVPFSRHPFIARDIAIFTPAGTDEGAVQSVIGASLAQSAGKLVVKGPDCFDRFEKGDRKSFAFRMIFQAFDRTLSDEEVNGFMQSLYEAVKAKGWEVR
jgi:phenylalanyl-tRNA synthetase beta chain